MCTHSTSKHLHILLDSNTTRIKLTSLAARILLSCGIDAKITYRCEFFCWMFEKFLLRRTQISVCIVIKRLISLNVEHRHGLFCVFLKAYGMDNFLVNLTGCSYKGICIITSWKIWREFDFEFRQCLNACSSSLNWDIGMQIVSSWRAFSLLSKNVLILGVDPSKISEIWFLSKF